MDRVPAYVGLGANLGAAQATLEAAVRALAALTDVQLEAVSRLYRTRPVGPVGQADFLNAVVALLAPPGPDPERGATALLIALKGLERALGRQPRQRWGPREVDLDLLVFGSHRIRVERPASVRSHEGAEPGVRWLEVPHPSAAERGFVLAPLADLAPGLEPPGWGLSVAQAAARARAAEGPAAVVAVGDWDPGTGTWTRPAPGRGGRRER